MAANMQAALGFSQGSRADALAGLQQRKAATSTLAGLEQSVAEANAQRFREQFGKELTGAQQLFTSSRAQERAAKDAQREAVRQRNQAMLGAVAGTVGGALQMQGVNKFGDIFKTIPGALSNVSKSEVNPLLISQITKGTDFEYGKAPQSAQQIIDNAETRMNEFGGIDNFDMPEENFFDPTDITNYDPNQLAAMRQAFSSGLLNKGGKVGKTGGEFNHDTNKKALIDEESGEKEAELTGDETMFVFNPKQTSTFEKLIKGDDAAGLMKFMKKLLKKPQFNK